MTTLTNSFHGTSARTRLTRDDLDRIRNTHPAEWTEQERLTVKRLQNKLCGCGGCTCGDMFGARELTREQEHAAADFEDACNRGAYNW